MDHGKSCWHSKQTTGEFKERVHLKMEMLSFTHPHFVWNLNDCLCSVKNKRSCLAECYQKVALIHIINVDGDQRLSNSKKDKNYNYITRHYIKYSESVGYLRLRGRPNLNYSLNLAWFVTSNDGLHSISCSKEQHENSVQHLLLCHTKEKKNKELNNMIKI